MNGNLRRWAAIIALSTGAFASSAIPPASAGPAVTRNDFIEAYVACNNAAWAGKKRRLIASMDVPTASDKMRGIDSHVVSGFMGESMYFDGLYGNLQPRRPATVGWALATKAFADRGEIDPRYRSRSAALAVLRERRLEGLDTLSDREVGALATEVDYSQRAGGRYALTPISQGTRLSAPLDGATARAMLSRLGTHFDVAPRKAAPQAGKACPAATRNGLLKGR